MKQPIEIPGLDLDLAAARSRRAFAQYEGRDEDGEAIEPIIEGFACVYNSPHEYKGRTEVLLPGCFGTSVHGNIEFRVDHLADFIVASSRSGLELYDSSEGLAFRLRVPATAQGHAVYAMATGDRSCMSVGYREHAYEMRTIAGREYRFVTSATLTEISQVRRGAVKGAFVRTANARTALPLRDAARSFAKQSTMQRLANMLQDRSRYCDRMADRLDGLASSLAMQRLANMLQDRSRYCDRMADRLDGLASSLARARASFGKAEKPPLEWTLLQQR